MVGKWKELDEPGYLEIDLVSHSGEVASGLWINTLCATDLSTGWTERVATMGHGQAAVVAAIEQDSAACYGPWIMVIVSPECDCATAGRMRPRREVWRGANHRCAHLCEVAHYS